MFYFIFHQFRFNLLVMPHHVTYRILSVIWIDWLSCGLTLLEPFPKQVLFFTCLQYKFVENTVGKGEIARNEQFLLFPLCFQPVRITFYHFHQI